MAGISSPPAEGRWDLARWDEAVWDGDAISTGIPLLLPGSAVAQERPGWASQQTDRKGSATVDRRPGNAGGGGRT